MQTIQLIKTTSLVVITMLCNSCAKSIFLSSNTECLPPKYWVVKKRNLSKIESILILKIDARRRKFNIHDFCAYQILSSNKKYGILNIWDEVGGNHVSSSWILFSNSQVLDTKLNSYTIVDSIKSKAAIEYSVSELAGIDSVSNKELTNKLILTMRYYAKQNTRQ